MRELIVPSEGEFHGDTKTFDRHDADRSNGRTDGEIDERVFLPVFWSDGQDHNDGEGRDNKAIKQESYIVAY